MNLCIYCEQSTQNISLICNNCEEIVLRTNNINTLTSNLQSNYAEERYYLGDIFDTEPDRCISKIGTIKNIDNDENLVDNFNYFSKNKLELEKDFKERLIQSIGEDKTNEFLLLISKYWYIESKRNSKKIKALKCLIKELSTEYKVTNNIDCSKENILKLTSDDIKIIININKEMCYHYFSMWLEKEWDKSTNGIYFRRGIHSTSLSSSYSERDYISSYTLAISVSEQFSTMSKKYHNIVSAEYGIFNNRILFFSPFIENMPNEQFEIGVIPASKNLFLFEEKINGNIKEYILSDTK